MPLLIERPPVCGIAGNPALGMMPDDMREVACGRSLADLAEEFCPVPVESTILLCKLNGDYVSRLTPEQHEELDALVAAGKTEEAEAFEAAALAGSKVWETVCVCEGDIVEFFEMPQGNALRIVGGAALIAVGTFFPEFGGSFLVQAGFGLLASPCCGLLTSRGNA